MKIFFNGNNGILLKVATQFRRSKQIEGSSAVVLWQDVLENGKEQALIAKEKGIPIIVVEHGYGAHLDYLPPRSYPLIADQFCVWGKVGFEKLIAGGLDADRIKVVGCPLLSSLKARKIKRETTITFAPQHWEKDLQENLEIAFRLKDIKNIRVITKITDGHCDDWYENPILSLRSNKNHINICAEVLSQSDIVVSLGMGTFELMAMYLDIPVIIVDNWRPKNFHGQVISLYQSEACHVVSLKDLPDAIHNALKHPEMLRAERQQFIQDNAYAPGEASLNIANIVKKCVGSPSEKKSFENILMDKYQKIIDFVNFC